MTRNMGAIGTPTMTAAEIAAWESMIRDGSLWRYVNGETLEPGEPLDYRYELVRRAARHQEATEERKTP